MASKRKVGNLLALAVMSYLSQQPMHPYELGRTLREHGDARSIKFNHGSLYMVVGQLAKAGYIAELETSREGQRPERTVYALTDAGRAVADRGAAPERGRSPAAPPARPAPRRTRRDPRPHRHHARPRRARTVPG